MIDRRHLMACRQCGFEGDHKAAKAKGKDPPLLCRDCFQEMLGDDERKGAFDDELD